MSLQRQPREVCQVAQVQMHRCRAVLLRLGLEDQVPVGCRPALIPWTWFGPSCSNDSSAPREYEKHDVAVAHATDQGDKGLTAARQEALLCCPTMCQPVNGRLTSSPLSLH